MRVISFTPFNRITPAQMGMGFAWAGVLIYAAANSLATLLVDIGAASPTANGRNAITFINLFFLGSLISLIPLVALFRGDWSQANLRRVSRGDWAFLNLSAILSCAVTPGLFIFALAQSSVTNIALISRIEPPIFLLAAALLFKERLDPRVLFSGAIALAGAVWILTLRQPGTLGGIGLGDGAAALATLSYVASALVARRVLRTVPMGIFTIYRTAAGTVFYFLLISALLGPQAFQDVLSPVLLTWIWLYAVPVVVLGQLAWTFALKYARSGDMALASSFSPLAAILFAMLLLGEEPGPGLLPGGALILLAICVGRIKGPLLPDLTAMWRLWPDGITGRGRIAALT